MSTIPLLFKPFRSLEKALEYEIKRQTELVEGGGQVVQETRGWDDKKEITVSQRSKEEAADYRYFPEPDIPPLVISREIVEALRSRLPELPEAKAERYQSEYGLPKDIAYQLADDGRLMLYFEEAVDESNGDPKKIANWILSELLGLVKSKGLAIEEIVHLEPKNLGKLVSLIDKGVISGKIAKDIFEEVYEGDLDPENVIEEKGLKVMADTGELEKICQEVLSRNEKAADDFKAGNEKALAAIVGQVMAATKGFANPKLVNEILRKLLS